LEDYTEVLVAIGRIEEGIKSVRSSIERLEKKSDAQDKQIEDIKGNVQELELDVQKLETQRSQTKENMALLFALIAFVATTINIVSSLAGVTP
jgi:predicted  nucleic acid-binding Zn-ribbon protein